MNGNNRCGADFRRRPGFDCLLQTLQAITGSEAPALIKNSFTFDGMSKGRSAEPFVPPRKSITKGKTMKSIVHLLQSIFTPARKEPRVYIDSATFDPYATSRQGSAVILTARNEAATIFQRVQSARCESAGVVVIDQGSTDGTAYRAAEAGAVVVLQEEGMSLDEAVRKAMSAGRHFAASFQLVEN